MASVRQLTAPNREGKRPWVVEYTDSTGKRRRATPPSGLKKDADKLRQKIEREIEDGYHTASSETVTLAEAVQAWLNDCERRHKIGARMTGNTLHGYINYAEQHVIPALGSTLLTKLTALQCQDFIDDKSTVRARNSCKHMRLVLMQSLRFAVRKGWIKRNPLIDDPIEIPTSAAQRKVTCPTKDEIRQVLNALTVRRAYEQPHARANRILIVGLALFAGMRRGEIAGLQWEDVDLSAGVLSLRHSLSRHDGLKGTKTPAGTRTVAISPPLAALLDGYAETTGRERTGFVLRTRTGKPVNVDQVGSHDWRELMKAAGLCDAAGKPRYSLHTFRHAFISLLIDQGLQPLHIKAVAGHSRIATTMDIYGHMFPDDDRSRVGVHAMSAQFTAAPSLLIASPPQERRSGRDGWQDARAEALRACAAGEQPNDVARRLRVSESSVYNWLRGGQTRLETRA